jgi:hypothetical protein
MSMNFEAENTRKYNWGSIITIYSSVSNLMQSYSKYIKP